MLVQCYQEYFPVLRAEYIARAAVVGAGGPGLVGVEGVVSAAVKALA